MILSTVNVKLNWGAYMSTLKPRGRLHFLGATLDPIEPNVFSLLVPQCSVSSSPVGSPETITRMLHFAARHNIHAVTETYRFKDVNKAFEHLASGKARYRIVLSHS